MPDDSAINPDAQQRYCRAYDCVKHPEQVGRAVLVDDHMATDLAPVESIVPYLECRHQFKGDDMEYKDVECVVPAIDQKTFHHPVMTVNP